MDGRWLALGSVAAIAAAGIVRQRGSFMCSPDPTLIEYLLDQRSDIVRLILELYGEDTNVDSMLDFEFLHHALTPMMERKIERLVGYPVQGHGASRIVFRMDDEFVFKLALDVVGMESNLSELQTWRQSALDPEVRDFLVPIVDSDPSGEECRYVVMEYAESVPKTSRRDLNQRYLRWEELVEADRPGACTMDVDAVANWGLHEGKLRIVDYECPL